MIRSNVRRLRFEKEERERRKLTYEVLTEETGLGPSTLARLLRGDSVERIDGSTLDALCRYFGCGVGDVLEYVGSDDVELEESERAVSAQKPGTAAKPRGPLRGARYLLSTDEELAAAGYVIDANGRWGWPGPAGAAADTRPSQDAEDAVPEPAAAGSPTNTPSPLANRKQKSSQTQKSQTQRRRR